MKKLIITLVIVVFVGTLRAQITINQGNFPYVERAIYQNADSSTVPGLATNNGSFWDLGSVQKFGTLRGIVYSQVSNHPVFSVATEFSEAWQLFGPLPVRQQKFNQKSATGYASLGIGYEDQRIALGFLSGNNNDTLIFPAQTYTFSTPYQEFKFPLTLNTQWGTSIFTHTDFRLKLFAFGYNNTPCVLNNYFTTQNEVISYGTCRVPAKGSPGNSFPVLLLKTEMERVDSFYIDGQPANPFLLAALNVGQGDTIRTYQYRILRENAGMQELAIIEFEDNTYATVKKAEYSGEFDALSISNLSIQNGIMVYPNPSNGEGFTVNLDDWGETTHFKIFDTGGKQIPANSARQSNNTYFVTPVQPLATGMYVLQAENDTKNAIIKLIVK